MSRIASRPIFNPSLRDYVVLSKPTQDCPTWATFGRPYGLNEVFPQPVKAYLPTTRLRRSIESKAIVGLRPSFSAHVRCCEHGAPVRFPSGFCCDTDSVGTAENSPGLQSWVKSTQKTSPEGTTQNNLRMKSWVLFVPKQTPSAYLTTTCSSTNACVRNRKQVDQRLHRPVGPARQT